MLRTPHLFIFLLALCASAWAISFGDPPQFSSSGGLLDVTIEASLYNTTVAGGQLINRELWNDTFVAPTFRLRRGDTFKLVVINRLKQMTNIHWHGMELAPVPGVDDIFVEIDSGASYIYQFQIPTHHPQGVFWYHSHAMKYSQEQVFSGMSGLVIVDGMLDSISALASVPERIFTLRDPVFFGPLSGLPPMQVVNGLLQPVVAMAPGEIQLWRFANIGSDTQFNLSLPGVQAVMIARDGRLFSRGLSFAPFLLASGGRIDLLVTGPDPGNYSLLSEEVTSYGPTGVVDTLAIIQSAGSPIVAPLIPATLSPSAPDLRAVTVSRNRTFVFSASPDGRQFYINGEMFNASRLDVTVTVGDIEEWLILNNDSQIHSFHIHQLGYQVLEVNGVPVPFLGYQETVIVPLSDPTAPGDGVRVRIPFTDPTIVGRFVFHCHFLAHEDGGMMQQLQVLPATTTTPPTTTHPNNRNSSSAHTLVLSLSLLLLLLATLLL